ncbi:MAG: hypothetical protein LUD68_09280 [Rikenellaceae bacterium]|nr:hypothetical protein [Rikenellaceae bacterium]
MLNKIIADCMGGAMYDALVDLLNGKTLIFEFDPSLGYSQFDASAGSITLGDYESNSIFHEMFHVYQWYNETPQTIGGVALNHEMEAWYAQYRYVSKLPEYQEGTKWHTLYNKHPIGYYISRIDNHLTPQGQFKNNSNYELFGNYLINYVKSAFELSATYRKYPFDYNRYGNENFTNFVQLSKGC